MTTDVVESIEKIGRQVRAYDRKIAAAEERLGASVHALGARLEAAETAHGQRLRALERSVEGTAGKRCHVRPSRPLRFVVANDQEVPKKLVAPRRLEVVWTVLQVSAGVSLDDFTIRWAPEGGNVDEVWTPEDSPPDPDAVPRASALFVPRFADLRADRPGPLDGMVFDAKRTLMVYVRNIDGIPPYTVDLIIGARFL